MAFKPKKPPAAPAAAPTSTPPPAKVAAVARFVPKFSSPIKKLPSGGKAYPVGLEVRYRPYSFGEIKTINQSTLSIKEKILEILEGITVSSDFDPLDLTLQDGFFLGFSRKRETFLREDKIVIPHHCAGCDRRSDFIMQENKDLDFYDLAAPKLPIGISLHGEDFSFTALTIRQYFSYLDHLTKAVDDNNELDAEAAMMAVQCVSHSFEEAYQACFNAPPEGQDDLVEVDKMLRHELKPVTFKCTNKVETDGVASVCGHESTLRLDEVGRLVLPFRDESGEPRKSRLRFGLPG